ncbi:MAG: ATP-binding protein [Pseudolysinimonas sp.]
MTDSTQHTIRMYTPPDSVDTVHDLLEDVWTDAPSIPAGDRLRFETALIELASNVIRHADGGSGVTCTLMIETFPDRIEATLSDSGEPGNVQLAEREMPDDLSESGRGIPLIQALVDELSYDRDGSLNRWHIMRKFED